MFDRSRQIALAAGTFSLCLAAAATAQPCEVPDNGNGTVFLPPAGCGYASPTALHMMIEGLPPGTTIVVDVRHRNFLNIERFPGGNFGPNGEIEIFDSTLILQMSGTGGLAGFQREIEVPAPCEVHTGERNEGDPVQTFPNEMVQLQGQLFGDPDFDVLTITAGTGNGFASTGSTTLTDLGNGSFTVDSFFDIEYEIDFVGAPGGALDGLSGTTPGTSDMATNLSAIGGAYFEDFDSYATGPLVTCSLGVCSGPNGWTSWDNDEGAAGGQVSSAFSHSPPNSICITGVDDMVIQFPPGVYQDGVYKLSVQVYVQGAMTDNQYFILLNQYDGQGLHEWSMDLEFDGATGKVRDFESGGEVDMVTDQWALVEVIMNLNDDPSGDTCTILYDGALVASRDWSQGGTTTLQAIDLWGDLSTFSVYYDDIVIEELPETGACCLPSEFGDCINDSTVGDCDAAAGTFEGFGSLCAAANCPSLGPDGWIVDAPFTWSDDSSRSIYNDDFECSGNFGFNGQVQWEVTIPWPETWTFSVCGSVSWDTQMGLGSSPCGVDLAFNDDGGCLNPGSTDSAFSVALTPGTYYLTLAGVSGADSGSFNLTVDASCALDVIPGSIAESEAACFDDYVDTYNAGCNALPHNFLPVSCGDAYLNSTGRYVSNAPACPPGDIDGDGDIDFQDLLLLLAGWSPGANSCVGCPEDVDGDGDADFQDLLQVLANWDPDGCPTTPVSARDTDWWFFELTETTEVNYTGTGTFPLQMLLITIPGTDAEDPDRIQGCLDLDIPAFALPGICETGTIVRTLDPGRYALWGGPQGGTDPVSAPCGSL